jgi:hypothetical protein
LTYRCREEDREDLTAAVQAKLDAAPSSVFGLTALRRVARIGRSRRQGDVVTVVVCCSKGHENVFRIGRRSP